MLFQMLRKMARQRGLAPLTYRLEGVSKNLDLSRLIPTYPCQTQKIAFKPRLIPTYADLMESAFSPLHETPLDLRPYAR